ncbi:MAG: hypothetical protein JWR16_3327 [Nevskia sp.]|nr:hypothetical protein [Nevskia sp.]
MALEIERKFLVSGDGWRAQVFKQVPMRHGYLQDVGGRASVRVRLEGRGAGLADEAHASRQGGPWVGVLNIKAAVVGAARAEYEYEIPVTDAQEMLDKLCAGLILKTRHYVRAQADFSAPDERDSAQALVWEIDEFEGCNAGLVVAEIELTREDQTFVTPEWLGREVTAERRYYNHALASNPYRDWPLSERN